MVFFPPSRFYRMSSVEKGEAFEMRVFHELKRALESEDLGLLPRSCDIYHKQRYFSRDRQSHIEFDVSIEVRRSTRDRPFLLWLWECKDYASSVPVSDLEEFWAKLQQISEYSTKGGLATTAPLQIGALRYARSKGISVLRVFPQYGIDDWRFQACEMRPHSILRFLLTPIIDPVMALAERCVDAYNCVLGRDPFVDDALTTESVGESTYPYTVLGRCGRKTFRNWEAAVRGGLRPFVRRKRHRSASVGSKTA